jgi:mannose-6-phosphate isomerase-like protein (cupin superfamily)
MLRSVDAFEIAELSARRRETGRPWLEFLRVPACSAGVYELPAGGVDPQKPHTEDEIYYVVKGRGAIRVGDEDREVAAGTVVFVPANQPHHFHSIREDLTLLVFFAPAERSP